MIEVYDGLTGVWSTISFPETFAVDAAAVVGTKAVYAGRFSQYNVSGYTVEVYDTATGTFSSTALSEGRDSELAISSGTKAYFAGGKTAANSGESSTVDIFTDAMPAVNVDGFITAESSAGVDLTLRNNGDADLKPGALVSVTASSSNSSVSRLIGKTKLVMGLAAGASIKIHVPATNLPAGMNLASERLTATLSIKGFAARTFAATNPTLPGSAAIPATNLLSIPTQSPLPLQEPGVAVDGKVVFGAQTTDATGTISSYFAEIYDTATGVWTSVTLDHPLGNSTTVLGNRAYFAGGASVTGGFYSQTASDIVDIFDASTNQFSITHLSKGRFSPAAVSVGNKVISAGGYSEYLPYSGPSGLSDVVDVLDTTTGNWTVAHLSASNLSIRAIVAGGKALFSAGDISFNSGQPFPVDVYDAATGA